MFNLTFVLRESMKLHILGDPKVTANILQITQYGYVKLQYRFAVIPGSPSKKNSWTLLMFTLKFINDYVNSSDIIIMLRCRNFLKVNIIAQHSMPCCELLLNMAWFGRWLTTGWPLVCTSSQSVLSPQYRCFVLNFTGKVCFKICYSFIDMSKK